MLLPISWKLLTDFQNMKQLLFHIHYVGTAKNNSSSFFIDIVVVIHYEEAETETNKHFLYIYFIYFINLILLN